MSEGKLLEVSHLRMFYRSGGKDVRAVDDISFDIQKPGQALAIVGESGCGKSSLGLALLKLLPQNVSEFSGRVYLENQELLSLPAAEFNRKVRWKKIAWVPQRIGSALNPIFRVGGQIEETLKVHRVPNSREEMLKLLKVVGLSSDKAGVIPDQLSGGEQQRVCIAKAIALKPRLIILDEPTSALDPSLRGQIISLLEKLKREFSCSYIFITHDIVQASSICEFFAVIYAGRIVEKGTREDVLNSPVHPYTQKLLDCIMLFGADRAIKYIPGEPPDLKALPKGCCFQPRCEKVGPGCKEKAPLLEDRGGGHFVACHHKSPPP